MSGRNAKEEGKPTNEGEGARKSKNNGRRRKKRKNDGTVSRRSDGPFDTVVNGVFLKSIRPEDTKALAPADWKKVRDYVLNERKKLAEKNGPMDDNAIKHALADDEAGDSNDGKLNESMKSPPEHTSETETNVAADKSNVPSKKKKATRNNSCGPTNVTINGVFLKSIWLEDIKALSPADWEQVRDYVIYERKKLAEKNGTNDDHNISPLDSVSTNIVSTEAASTAGDAEVESPPEYTSANTNAKTVAANKSNGSKKKKKEKNGGKDADSEGPVKDSVSLAVDGQQNSSSNNSRAKGKNKSSNTSSQNDVSTKQRPAKSGVEIDQSRGKSDESSAKRNSAAIDVDCLPAQLCAEEEQRLAAVEEGKLERARADGLAKQATSLDQELKRATKALEKSKSEGKRHLTIQKQLLEAHKKGLSTVNASLRQEQSNVAKLKSQLVLEMAAKKSCAKELDKMKDLIASERKKVKDLQDELDHTTTAKNSMEQELSDNELRAERVKKLELELREERAKIAKLGNNPPKATVTLRKELHETQEKLKNAKKRNAVLTSELSQKSYPQRQQQTGYISQRETMGSDGEAPRKTSPKVASSKRATSMPAPVEVSLSERASLVNFESAPVHYDGVVVDNDDDSADESSGVQDELTFIRSAFSSNEISVDDNQVTYTLQLPVDNDSDDVKIDISVILPARYPSVGINDINVALAEASTCCPEIRKIALDALRTVQNICLIEARALEGSVALSTIFSAADMWAKDDWYGVMAKQLSLSKGKGKSSKNSGGKGSFEICTFLIYTHHVKDPDKIHFVKKCASKLNLCGYIKIGKPGLILVEGPQSDCEALLEILVSSRKKLRERGGKSSDTAKFSSAGKVVRNAKTSSERVLPKKLEQLEAKDGMDKITDACKKSGLLESLEEVCKR